MTILRSIALPLLAWLAAAAAVEPLREVHGSADAFAVQGVAVAWAVLRAANEDDTAVVLRVEPDVRLYARVEVAGRDPFTPNEVVLFPAAAVAGAFDVKIPRGRFADYPRTEIRLWAPDTRGSSSPALIVYFAGVPDTTPELARSDELERSLDERIARARAAAARKTP